MGKVIGVGGLIAAGKSTFMKNIQNVAERAGMRVKIMPELYSNSVKQLVQTNLVAADCFLLGHRIQMLADAIEIARNYDFVFIERTPFDHLVFNEAFTRNAQTPKENLELLECLVKENNPQTPDFQVYLKIPANLSYERMVRRNTDAENANVFTIELIELLFECYESRKSKLECPFLELSWEKFDTDFDYLGFLGRLSCDQNEILNKISFRKSQIN